MWRVSWSGLRFHRLRYALTALAVVLGVAFLAGTLVLTDTIQSSFDGLYTTIYRSTDAVVRGSEAVNPGISFEDTRPLIPASLAARVARVPGVREVSANVTGYAQLVGANGRPIGNPAAGPPTLGEAWPSAADMNPYRLAAGRPPTGTDEVAIDQRSAQLGRLHVGDRVVVLTTHAPRSYRISAIVTWGGAPSPLGASLTIFPLRQAAAVLARPGMVNTIAAAGSAGLSEDELVARLRSALAGARGEVISGTDSTAAGQQNVHQVLGFLNTFLLAFALIALFVGSYLVFNTFSIVLAQRERELALLRALGARRSQLLRAVFGEALAIGAVAAILGLGAGVALALGLKALLSGIGLALPATSIVLAPRTIVAALAVGVAVTAVAAILPARRATAIAPVAALHEAAQPAAVTTARRVLTGSLCAAAGAGALGLGLFRVVGAPVAVVGAGAALFFVGLTVLAPLAARAATRALGAPFARHSAAGRLAQLNAMRNPHRSAATASALMIGVALITVVSVLGSSTRASVEEIVNRSLRADFVVAPASFGGGVSGFSPTLEHQIAALPVVAASTGVRVGVVRIAGQTLRVLAVDPKAVGDLFDVGVVRGRPSAMGPHTIAISSEIAARRHLNLGSRVVVGYPRTGRAVTTVALIYSARSLAGDYVLPLAAAEANFASALDSQIDVKLRPGVSIAAGRRAIGALLADYPTARLYDQAQYKAQMAATIDQSLTLVDALLALAVLIAIVGIANTLALSVHERRREIALLRAVGMTRRQLRQMVRAESVVLALFGAGEGLLVGVLLGAVLVLALASAGVTTLAVPVASLLATAGACALAGLLAASAPARRAARTEVLQAISAE
jgi:putative ABC transport system permease protein